MFKFTFALALLLVSLICHGLYSPAVQAQDNENLLTTFATTVESPIDGSQQAYLLWQPGEAGATLGARFAIYRKPGDADANTPYTRLGIQSLQTSRNTIHAMLKLGETIDLNPAGAASRIDGIYRQITYDNNSAPPANAASLDVAGKLHFILQSGLTDPEILSRLFFLGRTHPGVMLALGHAFVIPIDSGTFTFEIREVDLADTDLRVVGRVTLNPTSPLVLEAPAAPFQVAHPINPASASTISAKDHLNARLRWGMSDDLINQLPHTFGFDVYRVKAGVAQANGWDATPPSADAMLKGLAGVLPTDPSPDISRANLLPVLADEELSPVAAADPNNTETVFFADDGIWHQGAGGDEVRRPYEDGEAFYYFVAARDIAGHPGSLSPGSLVVMANCLPPSPPSIESVLSQFIAPTDIADWNNQGGEQYLQVKLRQKPNVPATERATGYYVYRWSRSQEYLENVGNPLIGRIGYIPHTPGETFNFFDDTGAGAPTLATHADKSVWYTVRAVGDSSHPDELLSGHSSPLPGFLRDFKAPSTVDGDFTICWQFPVATWQGRQVNDQPDAPAGVTVNVNRDTSSIVAADVKIVIRQADQTELVLHEKRHAFQFSDTLEVTVPYREPTNEATPMIISVSAVTASGATSEPAVRAAIADREIDSTTHFFQLESRIECLPISSVPDPFPTHEAYDVDGNAQSISGFVAFNEGENVHEWRIYRRVGSDGELTLIAKGEGNALTSPAPWTDDALPAEAGSRVCYYAQVFDQNKNPSRLIPLGCATLLNPDLPTPMLAPVKEIAADNDQMVVTLEWFSDPVGVDRFEVLIARQDGGIAEPSDGLSPLLSSVSLADVSDDFPNLDFFRFQTPRVGGVIGNGPAFSLEVTLPADSQYKFALRACGPGDPTARAAGSASNVASASWRVEPDTSQPIIPWPAVSLPNAYDHRLSIPKYIPGEGPLWPFVLPMEGGFTNSTAILVGVTRGILSTNDMGNIANLLAPEPPESYLFKTRAQRLNATPNRDLMPFILYRYQVPSARFPDAQPNLVQCTPYLDRMSWRSEVDRDTGLNNYEIRDPYFKFFDERILPLSAPVAGGWTDSDPPEVQLLANYNPLPPYLEDYSGLIVLYDLLPVTQGARYRHLIVQFDEKRGEITRVIPLDPIQH